MKNVIFQIGKMCAVLACIASLSSCAREISSNVYAADSVGEASRTLSGVVISARGITVQDSERLQDNGLGIIGGGLAGAYGGSHIGKGDGNTLATIGGAVIGATAGAFAEKSLKTQQGIEYVVKLDNGEAMTVVQAVSPQFSVGQNVYVIISHQGRSRVIAR